MTPRRIFLAAGVVGLLLLLPNYALERQVGLDYPPAVTHPEFYYGFTGVGVAWQAAFLIIARDPARYRALMLPGILEKVLFGFGTLALVALGRTAPLLAVFAGLDLVWAALFTWAYTRTPAAWPDRGAA